MSGRTANSIDESELVAARERNARRLSAPKRVAVERYLARPTWAYSPNVRKYGLTPDDYVELSKSQNDRCAICGCTRGKRAFAIDHCHSSGRVRGLLCSKCNTGIGLFRDNPDLLRAAIDYLERSGR